MKCKFCGEHMPDPVPPAPVVREVVKEVEVGENAFWLRLWRNIFVLGTIAVAVTGAVIIIGCYADGQPLRAMLADPTMKIEYENAWNGKERVKATREPRQETKKDGNPQ